MSPTTSTPSMWTVKRDDGTVTTGWYLMPLRLFLGVTFLFAGLQKLANPNFFKASSPISIHAQLVGGTHSSPIHALLSHLVPISTALGIVISVGEVAIGVGILVGLWTRVAAVAGMALSFGLFLTVSYHSSPYFTGSDIVFFFAWTPLALAGAAGAPAVDTWLAEHRALSPDTASEPADGVSRRTVLSRGAMTGIVAAVVLITTGLASVLGRAAGGADTTSASGSTKPLAPTASTSTTTAPASTTTTPGVATTTVPLPSGTSIGTASSVPVGGAATFTDPSSGDPGLVIQQTAEDFVAFDAVCPHAGCTVAYQSSSRIIACPCHGSEFNPKTGAVVRGPATNGLTKISVIKGSNGDLYIPK